jgi:RNA polymerase sigma-70 factor (ECF subfamily)
MSRASERVLIGRALEGDQRAFSSLYRAYRLRIYGMIAPRAVDRDDAEDVVQVTFVKAFQSLRKFRGGAAFST